ncbi:PaaI family thioesterase [Rhizobiaceae sp. 2RAB30]
MLDRIPDGGGMGASLVSGGAALEAAGWTRMRVSNFSELVGPVWMIPEGDKRRFGFFVEEKHDNSQRRVHGGMIMTFCDDAMGTTAVAGRPGEQLFTISFDCQFISAAQTGEFVEAICEVVKATRSLMFMRSTCFVADRVVAACSGVWKVTGKRQARDAGRSSI